MKMLKKKKERKKETKKKNLWLCPGKALYGVRSQTKAGEGGQTQEKGKTLNANRTRPRDSGACFQPSSTPLLTGFTSAGPRG